jgi:hypothetical protein
MPDMRGVDGADLLWGQRRHEKQPNPVPSAGAAPMQMGDTAELVD